MLMIKPLILLLSELDHPLPDLLAQGMNRLSPPVPMG
jgi:hypothetical protein